MMPNFDPIPVLTRLSSAEAHALAEKLCTHLFKLSRAHLSWSSAEAGEQKACLRQ